MQRFFVPPEDLIDEEIVLSSEVLHHLGTVLRRGEGEEILLLDGAGLVCRCHIVSLGRKGGVARVIERWVEKESAFPITLLQGLPKGDKIDLVLQKWTELGVTSFAPALCSRSIPSLTPEREAQRMSRWQKIVREAARQSRRSHLPHLFTPVPLGTALKRCHEELRLLLWEEESLPLTEALPHKAPRDAVVLIGPEGGITQEEASEARKAGFIPVRFGPRILRSETAGLSVASILQYLYGDLGAKSGRLSHDEPAPGKEIT
jgi:16S rRNA (uracil1498-N3)-methyltransferase